MHQLLLLTASEKIFTAKFYLTFCLEEFPIKKNCKWPCMCARS
jgi:hypothetical protein